MKTFLAGQTVWVRGIGRLGWSPYVYVRPGTTRRGDRRHVVESLSGGRRVVPDGRIRGDRP